MSTSPNQTSELFVQSQNSLDQPPAVSSHRHRSRKERVAGAIGILVAIILLIAAYFYRSVLYDYAYAHFAYHPSQMVSKLAGQLDLTERGRDIFYTSQPLISTSTDPFPCKSGEENSVILGCYQAEVGIAPTGLIYVLDVQNDSLKGVMPVTAAHELLHAAYARLNGFQKTHVNEMVQAEYKKIENDPVIKDQMEYYKIAEPGQNLNELHSIIGTTVASLDPDLEAYYAQYFTDREAIVTDYQNYYQMLHKNDEKIKKLEKQVKAESASLKSDIAAYQTDLKQLNLDIKSFNARANSGGFSSEGSFQIARSALVARVNTMDAQSVALNKRIAAYNADVKEINSLSAETQKLYSSLEGVKTPNSGV